MPIGILALHSYYLETTMFRRRREGERAISLVTQTAHPGMQPESNELCYGKTSMLEGPTVWIKRTKSHGTLSKQQTHQPHRNASQKVATQMHRINTATCMQMNPRA